MPNELITSLTHDAEIATLIKNAETNLDTLLMVNGALSCLSQMVLRATTSDQIEISNLGCLIWLCDRQVDQLTDIMCLQLDQHPPMRSPKIV